MALDRQCRFMNRRGRRCTNQARRGKVGGIGGFCRKHLPVKKGVWTAVKAGAVASAGIVGAEIAKSVAHEAVVKLIDLVKHALPFFMDEAGGWPTKARQEGDRLKELFQHARTDEDLRLFETEFERWWGMLPEATTGQVFRAIEATTAQE